MEKTEKLLTELWKLCKKTSFYSLSFIGNDRVKWSKTRSYAIHDNTLVSKVVKLIGGGGIPFINCVL